MTDVAPLGHIKLARKAFDAEHGDAFWLEHREFSRFEAWVFVIQLACYSTYRHQTAHGAVELERGEFVASLRWLGTQFKWNLKRVRYWIATCEKGARLKAQRETPAGTVYLIVNYDAYQSQGHNEGTAEDTDRGTAGAQQGHKREAVKAVKAVKSFPPAGADGKRVVEGWPARLALVWSADVGDVKPGRIGAALKPAVDRHGAERVERAMRAYIAVQKADRKPCKLPWFAEQSQVWIERTAAPLGIVDGEMSDTLELLTRPSKGAA